MRNPDSQDEYAPENELFEALALDDSEFDDDEVRRPRRPAAGAAAMRGAPGKTRAGVAATRHKPAGKPRPAVAKPRWARKMVQRAALAAPVCNCPTHGTEFVRWVQSALNRLQGAGLPVDGAMSSATRSALRAFQEQQGLPADSIVGPDTERALIEAGAGAASPTSDAPPTADGADEATDTAESPQELEALAFDEFEFEWESEINRSTREYIMWVQRSLNKLLGLSLAVDGISGTMTKSAVRSFQDQRGLAADGIVGPLTEASLVAAGADQPPGSISPGLPSTAPAPVVSPSARPRLNVPESALTALLPAFAGYTYDLRNPRYPRPLPGVSVPQAPPLQTNCCCFAESFFVDAFARHHGTTFQWSSERHNQMMILADFSDRFSPVTAVVQAGMATPIAEGAPPSAWSLVQGWRSSTSGHTFIVVAYHAPTKRVLTLEANNAYLLNGVGCRNFGNLRDLPGGRPPSRWWEDPRAPTWPSLEATYGYGIKMAKLGVTGLSWSGLPS
jgi:peptidoglycan hydrolase-like protein with peptidoglycan-binding domain